MKFRSTHKLFYPQIATLLTVTIWIMPDWSFEIAVNVAAWFVISPEKAKIKSKKKKYRAPLSGQSSLIPIDTIANPQTESVVEINETSNYCLSLDCEEITSLQTSELSRGLLDSPRVTPMNGKVESTSHEIKDHEDYEKGHSSNSHPSPLRQLIRHKSSQDYQDFSPFRATGLRFVLRCGFQMFLLSLAVMNIAMQLYVILELKAKFDHQFCFYSMCSLLLDVALFSVHIGKGSHPIIFPEAMSSATIIFLRCFFCVSRQ